MRIRSLTALLAGGLIVLCSTQTFAKKSYKKAKRMTSVSVTGLAAMHSITRSRGKLCFSNHYHFGDGTSTRSRARAMQAAKRSWASFVNAEYGSAWAHISISRSRGSKCSYRNGAYSCSISARPCKR